MNVSTCPPLGRKGGGRREKGGREKGERGREKGEKEGKKEGGRREKGGRENGEKEKKGREKGERDAPVPPLKQCRPRSDCSFRSSIYILRTAITLDYYSTGVCDIRKREQNRKVRSIADRQPEKEK